MIAPRIHLNGSDGETLLHEYLVALEAIQAATKALQHAAPNGRDYYVIDAKAYERARAEHEDRLRRLDRVASEIQAIAEAINDQLHTQEKSRRG